MPVDALAQNISATKNITVDILLPLDTTMYDVLTFSDLEEKQMLGYIIIVYMYMFLIPGMNCYHRIINALFTNKIQLGHNLGNILYSV